MTDIITKDEIGEELKNYKGAYHDDAVDALSYAIQSLIRKPTLWQRIRLWFGKLKSWFLKNVLKWEYSIGVDISENGDYSCKVTCKRNLRTGQMTIIKIEYF